MSLTIGRKWQSYTKNKAQSRLSMRKLICFQVAGESYALPIEQVQYILGEFRNYGSLHSNRSLIRFNNEDITLVDLSTLFVNIISDLRDRHYSIVCTLSQGERLGLPVCELPTVLEVSTDKFSDLPQLYRQGLPPAVDKLIHMSEGVEVFYLSLERLVSSI